MAKVRCEIEEIELEGNRGRRTDGVRATCSKCGHALLAKDLGKHRRTVHKWIVEGKLKAIAVGDVFAIPRAEARRIKEEMAA
jgi:excisionase family DNA binding protein